jgi:hypothetical protein
MADLAGVAAELLLASLIARLGFKGLLDSEDIREIAITGHAMVNELTSRDETDREALRVLIDQFSGSPPEAD